MFSEVLDELIVCQDPGLGQAIHSLADFDEDIPIVHQWHQVVEIDYELGDVCDWDAHVFFALHRRVQVEIGDVEDGVSCIWRGDHTVQVAFYCGHVDGRGADGAWVVD